MNLTVFDLFSFPDVMEGEPKFDVTDYDVEFQFSVREEETGVTYHYYVIAASSVKYFDAQDRSVIVLPVFSLRALQAAISSVVELVEAEKKPNEWGNRLSDFFDWEYDDFIVDGR